MRHIVLQLLVIVLLTSYAQAQPVTADTVVDAITYANDRVAQAAWQPMGGTAPVTSTSIDGRPALRMRCNFQGTKFDRASWDRAVRLDMSGCRAFQFRVYCRDSSPVSQFSIYFQSGQGWYSTTFAASQSGGWSTVVIPKEDTRMEGTPGGWAAVRTIRISAWRGKDQDAEFAITDLSLVGGRADICLVRNESAARTSPGEVDSVCQFTRSMAANLSALGLDYSLVSDLDLTPQRLADTRLVILPHNPAMASAATTALGTYLGNKGKLMAFYTMPSELRAATGIEPGRHVSQKSPGTFASIQLVDPPLAGAPPVVQQRSWNIVDAKAVAGRGRVIANWFDVGGQASGFPAIVGSDNCIFMTHVLLDDDPAAKRRLLLAMAGQLVPELWATSAKKTVEQIGRFGPYADWAAAKAALAPPKPGWPKEPTFAEQHVEVAELHREMAIMMVTERRFVEAIQLAQQSQRHLLEAFCCAQSPEPGEQRGFWCHSAFGPSGMTWDQSIRILADNGFNAIFPNMLWGGLAYYDSAVLPVAPEVKDRGDQIAQCVAACRKYGVACHVWKVNWNMGGRAPREFVERMKREGRTQVQFSGAPNDTWLCPSHPDNQKLETDAMVEVAGKYDVDGIHFDYIRYPGPDGCFCPGCRERFEKSLGRKVGNWPADVRRDPEFTGKWLDFRRDNITRTVAAVAEATRKIKPKVKISAAVFPNWTVDRDGVGQDWKLWCERGYVDFVCPMDYTPHNGQFENLVRQQVTWAGKTPCYPGIGLSTWTGSSDNLVRLIEQISITRKVGTHGFTVFEYQTGEAQDIVPLCGKGVTKK
ncbi:MAG: glycoside hydrolase family 10 protein [Tepidisphaerales bacterium]